ncbi:hypothetical protein B0H16DRAFT_334034 [Mycena metata]|uniref:Uncharacterized protein n=1 Tax=Mycena metata TaxID=1033252 RepID=A0AAD7NN32_9AGAR|nr:hypothetical protein B0H16DRAFT_334034 [Mycena metata]
MCQASGRLGNVRGCPITSLSRSTHRNRLLRQIYRFVEEEKERAFLRLLLQKDSRIAKIELFHRRLGMCVNTFEISSLVNIQTMLANGKRAQVRDTEALHAHLVSLEKNSARLLQTLEMRVNFLACQIGLRPPQARQIGLQANLLAWQASLPAWHHPKNGSGLCAFQLF